MLVSKPAWVTVLGCIALSCALGIALDLVTANVAVEYFTVHHPHVVDTESPWILAVVWGIGASWWAGAIAGITLAWINHRRAEPLPPRQILRWVAIACVVLWLVMIAILIGVYTVASIAIPMEARRESFNFDRRIMSVAVAHQYEYLLAAIALLVVATKTWRSVDVQASKEEM